MWHPEKIQGKDKIIDKDEDFQSSVEINKLNVTFILLKSLYEGIQYIIVPEWLGHWQRCKPPQ